MRRKLSAANGSNDGVSDSSSQDVYEFRLPQQESGSRHWSCSLSSSQESRRFPLPRTSVDRIDVFRKSRKVKVIDVESELYGSCSTQGSQGLEVFEISDKDFHQSKKLKKTDFDPFEYNSSEELEGIAVRPQRKGREDVNFDFSEDGDLWGSKKRKNNPYEYKSAEELERIAVRPQRKETQKKGRENGIFDLSEDGDLWGSKKCKSNPFEYNSSEELEGIAVPPQRKGSENGKFDLPEDGDLWGSKKGKSNPFEYNSSEELEGIASLPQRKGRENCKFDFSEDGDLWGSKKCKNSSQESDLGISQSRKHGCNELRMEIDGVSAKSKKKYKVKNGALEKKKKKKKKRESRDTDSGYIELTATLMETQESGETIEHADEVNFALDGLKKGQQVRARRASLKSLLSICGTLQQRRLLWAYGIARKIIDAIFGLSFDDTPSNLAAAALFYLLTSDGQDEHLLYSPSSIRFLIKLLKPLSSATAKDKSQPIGSKLLGLCKNAGYSQDSAKGTDSTSTELMHKVREILVNCKEMKPIDDSDGGKHEPELNPKWISMLTIEKACSSSISIEGFEAKDIKRNITVAKTACF